VARRQRSGRGAILGRWSGGPADRQGAVRFAPREAAIAERYDKRMHDANVLFSRLAGLIISLHIP
jgi:hypothetical protein